MDAIFSESLRALVSRKFLEARARKDVIFSDTQLAVLQNSSKIPIQLRYCPALGKKPEKTSPSGNKDDSAKQPFDPFDNPSPDLLVCPVPFENATHNIVLNKYPVIPNHFILATKANKPQTHLLEDDDLYLSHACLRAWEETGHTLFAFFNSGHHSGASQPHRHVQFLPVEDMRGGADNGWSPLCTTMTSLAYSDLPLPLLYNPSLPIVHFAVSLQDHPSPAQLLQRYRLLLQAAATRISGDVGIKSLEEAHIEEEGRSTLSYNLAMTTTLMAVLPRRKESAEIPNTDGASIAINGTILAGTMMAKGEAEWLKLRENPEMAQEILYEVSFAREGRSDPSHQNL